MPLCLFPTSRLLGDFNPTLDNASLGERMPMQKTVLPATELIY